MFFRVISYKKRMIVIDMEQHRIIPFYKAYPMPVYGAPAYGISAQAAPAYGTPAQAAPVYGTPAQAASAYGMPVYGAPPYALPGYMPVYMAQDTELEQDLQYLQEIFPEAARRYAAKVASVVDRLDYKGSMIYDEYPDRLRLQRLTENILEIIEQEEAQARKNAQGMNETEEPDEADAAPMERGYRQELIYVLLCYEIAKRRHTNGQDMSRFYAGKEQ